MIELGFTVSYSELINLLGTKSFGTPFRNIKRLEQLGVSVTIDHLSLAEIDTYLLTRLPVVACVHTADLGYWSKAVDHVVVVIGLDEKQVYVNDPGLSTGQQPIPRAEFELAQLHYDHLCAIIQR